MRHAKLLPILFFQILSTGCSPDEPASDEGSPSGGSPSTGGASTGGLGGGPPTGGVGGVGGAIGADDCAVLGESACEEESQCAPIFGYSAVGEENGTYVGCRYAGPPDDRLTCGSAIVCGYPADEEDACMIFTDDCLPADWTMVEACSEVSSCPDPAG